MDVEDLDRLSAGLVMAAVTALGVGGAANRGFGRFAAVKWRLAPEGLQDAVDGLGRAATPRTP